MDTLYKMGRIVELTGLSAELLRAWERRFDILDPVRTEGGHRLYTADDLAVLRRVQQLCVGGRSIGEVAALGRAALLGQGAAPAGEAVDRWIASLVDGARRLDAWSIESALDEARSVLDDVGLVREVIVPAARAVGVAWAEGGVSVAGEHLVSEALVRRVSPLFEAAGPAPARPTVVVAALPDEGHMLGTLILAWILRRGGLAVAWLGASVPFVDLEGMVLRHGVRAVLWSVTRPALLAAHRDALLELVRRRTSCRFWIGGPGADPEDHVLVAAGVRLPADPGMPWEHLVERVRADVADDSRAGAPFAG